MNELEDVLDEFDALWRQSKQIPSLGRFLDTIALPDEQRLAALLELIAIDMEYRWRAADSTTPSFQAETSQLANGDDTASELLGSQPLIEDYAKHLPEAVGREAVPIELIAEEFRIRHRWGDCPTTSEYAQRFGESTALLEALDAVRLELEFDGAERSQGSKDSRKLNTQCSRMCGDDETLPELTRLSRYRILKRLGQGGMGEVYLAEDTQLDRQVALKTPHLAERKNLRERFVNEAKATAMLQHPGICPVFDAGEIDGQPFLTMAFIEGPTLREFWMQESCITVSETLTLFVRIARAMQAAHDAGIVHRDLKPSNVMLNTVGAPVVMDFGLACRESIPQEERITQTGDTFGSPAYMSPEQVEGPVGEVGPASDIYSLGVMLFEALTGRLPFRGTVSSILVKIARDQPPTPSDFSVEVDPEIENLCLQMLAKDPAKRPVSMTAVAERLTVLRERLREDVQVRSSDQPAARPRRAWKLGAAVCVPVLILTGVVILQLETPFGIADVEPVKQSDVAESMSTAPPTSLASDFAFSFDGVDDHVVTPIVYDGSHPITIEAWLSPADPFGNGAIVSNATDSGILLHQSYDERTKTRNWSAKIGHGGRWIAEVNHASRFSHRRTHVATVWNQSTLEIYVDGQRQATGIVPLNEMPSIERPFVIGTKYLQAATAGSSNAWFHGEIDEVHISATARYKDHFTPQDRFQPDRHTLGLYHFEETSGTTARDSSGRGSDAEIVGATWVAAAIMDQPSPLAQQLERFVAEIKRPQPARTGPALRLVHPTAHVTVPPLDFDFSKPFTLEVWLTPESSFACQDWKRVVAQVGPLSLSIQNYHDVYAFQTWVDGQGLNVTSRWPGTALYDRRTHVAGQWNGEQLELFINGRRAPGLPSYRNLASGDAGENLTKALQSATTGQLTLGRRGVGKSVIGGLLDRFRLSRGIRYSNDFEPTDFRADERTVVLYDFHEGAGEVLHDVSGNGHDAGIVGAEWIAGVSDRRP